MNNGEIGLTYVGPETKLSKSEINSLNTILVQEKLDFDNRMSNIKREKSFETITDFFKPSGPISRVKSYRYRIKDRTFTTLHFMLDTTTFADQEGDIFLGVLDEIGTNISAIGYVLNNGYPIQLLHGQFGFVSRANGVIELIYRADKDTASSYYCMVSFWNEAANDTNNNTTK